MELRKYQHDEMVKPVRDAFRTGANRVLLTTATGGGKTAAFSYMVKASLDRGNAPWVSVHRDLLVRQASASLTNWGCPHGILAAGSKYDEQRAQVVSIQTLSARLANGWKPPRPSFLIADEAHHSLADSWKRVFDNFGDVPTLGVTATPCRLDGKGLGGVFDRLVIGPTPLRLMNDGYLCRPEYWGVPLAQMPDLSDVGTEMGDYSRAGLAKAIDSKPRLTGDVVSHYLRRAGGLKFCGFAVNIKHAMSLRDAFKSEGIPCEVIHGKLSDDERSDMVERLNTGAILGLWSVDLISEGFDLPAVSCVILCRPTKSLVFHHQSIGRGLRPVFGAGLPLETMADRFAAMKAGGKEVCIVLDHAGNLMRDGLGPVEMEQEWTLDGVKPGRSRESLPAVKQCPNCFRMYEPAPCCPSCGHVPAASERVVKAVAGSLKRLDVKELEEAQARAKRQAQGMAKSEGELVRLFMGRDRMSRGKAIARAKIILRARRGKSASG